MSLLVFMVQRAVKKMAMSSPHTVPPRPSPPSSQPPPSPPLSHGFSAKPSAQNIVVRDALWQGMPEKDLLAAYGPPVSRSSKTASCEIWTYPLADSGLTVTLENGKVLNWTD